jgi:hypothetical protein
MTMSLNRICAIALLAVVPATSFALPIDWHGAFGVDSTLISGFRRVKSTSAQTTTNDGSQEVALDSGNKDSLNFLSYVFKLNPTMVINDAATFKAELTTGYANGGFLGDSGASNATESNNIPVYYHNQATKSGNNNIAIRRAYLELYSDTATYLVGRHSYQWGLGAIYNEGANAWDRHESSRDGITMKLKVGNFHLSPFWSKTANTGYTTATDVKDFGVGLLYDNPERDIAFGLIYGIKQSNPNNTYVNSTMDVNSTTPIYAGETDVKITDIYFKKVWDKFDFALEVPLMSGDVGKTTAAGTKTSYSSKAILLQSNYKLSDTWTFGFDGGHVGGHDESQTKFGALYLNPNYQIANLLYRYNLNAVGDSKQSIYDSYITNSLYLKLRSSYSTEKWTFDTAVIYAKALEVAQAGHLAYNHTKNKMFQAVANQSKDLGTEIDANATYKWNNEVSLGASAGYLITGDYFAFTNDLTKKNEVKSSLILQVNTSVSF